MANWATLKKVPFPLARAARMHRDAGDRSGADRLLEEALRLAPKSWRPGLEMETR